MAYLVYDPKLRKLRELFGEEGKRWFASVGYQYDIEEELAKAGMTLAQYELRYPYKPPEPMTKEEYLRYNPPEYLAKHGLGRRYGFQTATLSPEQTAERGFTMPEGWQLKLLYNVDEGKVYHQALITPEGRHVEFGDVQITKTGEWTTAEELAKREPGLPPEVEYTPETSEMYRLMEILFPESITGDLEADLKALEQYINEAPEAFWEDIIKIGRTPDTESLITSLFGDVTEQTLLDLFGTEEIAGAVTEEGVFIPEGFIKDTWDAFYLSARQYAHKSIQFFRGVIPTVLFPDVKVGELRPGALGIPGAPYTPEDVARINSFNRAQRDKYRASYAENQLKFEDWVAKHPELQPPPKYKRDITKNLDLLLDPGYWVYTIADAASFTLAVMATTIGVGFATKNPYWGLAAGTAIATPSQSQELYEDLLAAGAPEDNAANIALPIGMFIASLEAVTDLPFLAAVSQVFKLPFRTVKKGVQDQLVKHTVGYLIKKGLIAGGLIEISELFDETAQSITHNAFVQIYDENRDLFESLPETWIKTLIATVPFAIFGGGSTMRHVSSEVAQTVPDSQKKDEGWKLDNITGEWYKPEKMVDIYEEHYNKLVEQGLTEEQARLKALNELARTLEGEKAISEAAKKIEEGIPLEPRPLPLPTEPEALAERILAQRRLEEARARIEAVPEVKEPAVEVVKPPPITEVEAVSISEMEMEVTGLREWLATEPAAKLVNLIKKTGWYKGEISNLTVAQYKKLTGKTPLANILTKDKKHVRWEYALDDIATEMGYESGDALRAEIERAGEALTRIKELEAGIKRVEIEPVEPKTKAEEIEPYLSHRPLTLNTLSLEQIDKTLQLFTEAITSPTVEGRRAAAIELRKHERAQRAHAYAARVEELIIEGKSPEEAMNLARQETMSGQLPQVTTDYFTDLTQEMRDVLFAKVYHHWRNIEPDVFEEMSTVTALTNALQGLSIPRVRGIGTKYFPQGGSAYDRLARVFADQPQILEVIDQKKALPVIIEGIFIETGRAAVPIDQKTIDYLQSLATLTKEERLMLEKPLKELNVNEVRIIVEREYFRRKQELDTALAEGRISETEHHIELSIAKDKVYPYKPAIPLEAPISEAFQQLPLLEMAEKKLITRILKELAMSPIDIGSFLRANKASCDFSFWRQAKTLTPGHPAAFYRANIEAWKALWSQRSAEANWEWITHRPSYPYYANMIQRVGKDFLRPLELPKGTEQWKGVEEYGYLTGERLIPRWTAKIPWVKWSARSFITGTNTMNMLVYDQCLEASLRRAEKIASGEIKLKEGEAFDIQKEMDDYAGYITDMTQRAVLGKAAPLAPALGSMFFAPRSKLGRLLTPRHLLSKNPRVRALAWKDLSLFVGTFASLVMLGKWLDLWDVEDDPQSAEYMSIRIGNLRIDPWAGNRQILVFYTRIISGTGISSVTGKEYEVNPIAALTTFIRTSLSPMASIITDFWTGKNFLGEEVDVADKEQWLERMAPFSVWDVWEAFQDSWQKAAIAVLPAIVGEGVQTYTGDWVENWGKLGLPKYTENTAYGIKEPYYDTADFWADTAAQFKGVDPATLTEAKGYPPYLRAIVEAMLILEQLGEMPNAKLVSINADPEEGATFADYYKMWQDRLKIVASGDEEKLKEFDADERTRRAFLGNMTQTQFALLMEYHLLPEMGQKDFLEMHPEIGINPRNDWLMSNPIQNAQLAIWGKAKILSLEAYNEVKRLIKELDIPDAAIPKLTEKKLAKSILELPESSVENYFAFNEILEERTWNSWEAQLLLAKDDALREALGYDPIETTMRSLELKIKHRDATDLEEQYKNKENPLYIEDADERQDKLREILGEKKYQEWVDDYRRIEAIEHEGVGAIIEAWVERGRLVDEFSGGSSEVKAWLIDHPEVHKWALEQDLLTDDGSDWNEPVLRINAKWRVEDDEYDALETDKDRATYLAAHPEYYKDRYRRNAYSIEGFSEELIDTYVEWYTSPTLKKPEGYDDKLGWYEDDWFLQEHPEFYNEMLAKDVFTERRDYRKVPTRKVFTLWIIYRFLPDIDSVRKDFRRKYYKLDGWFEIAKGYKLTEGDISDQAKLDMWEELARTRAGRVLWLKRWL